VDLEAVGLQSLHEVIKVLEVFKVGLGMDLQMVNTGTDKGEVANDGLQEPLKTGQSSLERGL